jgi:hypothetical protein
MAYSTRLTTQETLHYPKSVYEMPSLSFIIILKVREDPGPDTDLTSSKQNELATEPSK